MKKLPLIITVLVVLLVAASLFVYDRYVRDKKQDDWNLIPSNALAVFEFDRKCSECSSEFKKTNVWLLLRELSLSGRFDDTIASDIIKLISKSQLTVSFHQVKKDEIDVVFLGGKSLAEEFLGLAAKRKLAISKRIFNDETIHEIKNKKLSFSWTTIDDRLVGSFTPFLIEDVIRTHGEQSSTVSENFREVRVLPKISGDIGNLYIRLDRLNEILSLFYNRSIGIPATLGKSTVLDSKYENGKLILNGFTLDTTAESQHLFNIFKKQTPTAFQSRQFISNRAIAVTTFGISNGIEFHADLLRFQRSTPTRDSLERLFKETKVDRKKLFATLGKELAIQTIQSVRKGATSKTILFHSTDVNYWLKSLEKMSKAVADDSLMSETYSGNVIRELPSFRIVENLLTPLVSNFVGGYYTNLDNYLLISEDLQDLKVILNDIAMEETWGKSLRLNSFFESTLLESSVSVYFNLPRSLTAINGNLHQKWATLGNQKKDLIQTLGMGCIQFSHLNNSFYTNSVFECSDASQVGLQRNRGGDRVVVNFESPVTSIHVVKSHVSRDQEVLIQDSLNYLSLISGDGTVLWKKPAGSKIVGEVTQVDFFNNGKLQYFFATRSSLHVIDRLGNYVSGFPLQLGYDHLSYASVIDYDNSKNYRFLAVDSTGGMWMFDKNGNNLDGWRPRHLSSPLIAAPHHIRVKGKDYVVAPLQGGLIAVMNRRGEMIKNFPLKLSGRIQGEFAFEGGNDLKKSLITIVTDDAFKITINLLGELTAKEPLLKNTINTKFKLIADKAARSYVILQQDAGYCKVLNDEGKEILSNETISDNPVSIDFKYNSNEDNFISIIDRSQELTFVYDFSGKIITDPPIESSQMAIKLADGRYKAFYAFDKTVVIQEIQ